MHGKMKMQGSARAAVNIVILSFFALNANLDHLQGENLPRWLWPTPNTAFSAGRPLDAYIQATESGNPESGGFGCVREGDTRFHEGLDLKAVRHNRAGEAEDSVVAVFGGKVSYLNKVAGNSTYGRYAVIEHDQVVPSVYTLYAHLRSIDPGIGKGRRISAGQQVGVMGRSAAGYSIPRSRAHLHFEIGLRLSDRFQNWYRSKGFETPNQHGIWNGMNLVGTNPLKFYKFMKARPGATMGAYMDTLPTAFTLVVHARGTPDFVLRYPSLLPGGMLLNRNPAGWEIGFTACGLPKRWRALDETELPSPFVDGRVVLLARYERHLKTCKCRQMITETGGVPAIGAGLRRTLEIIFGFNPK